MSKSQSPFQFSLLNFIIAVTVIAVWLAYICRPLREVIYVDTGHYRDSSNVVEFESGRRVEVGIEGRVGDKFKMQSWFK